MMQRRKRFRSLIAAENAGTSRTLADKCALQAVAIKVLCVETVDNVNGKCMCTLVAAGGAARKARVMPRAKAADVNDGLADETRVMAKVVEVTAALAVEVNRRSHVAVARAPRSSQQKQNKKICKYRFGWANEKRHLCPQYGQWKRNRRRANQPMIGLFDFK